MSANFSKTPQHIFYESPCTSSQIVACGQTTRQINIDELIDVLRLKMTIFWDVAPYCLDSDGNIGQFLPDYTEQHPRRQPP
jgi:hypothetical protein